MYKTVDEVKQDDGVGLFVIAAIFPVEREFVVFKFLPALIHIVQWIFFAGLLIRSVKSYESGWCPRTGMAEERAVMLAISALIFVRCFLRAYTVLERISSSGEKLKGSWLIPYSCLDWISEAVATSAALLLNLFIVFTSDGAQDMVMNCIALEFIGELDNEVKKKIFSIDSLGALEKLNQHAASPPIQAMSISFSQLFVKDHKETAFFSALALIALLFTVVLVPGAALVMMFYGPICKP
jgi:hypothetical protein